MKNIFLVFFLLFCCLPLFAQINKAISSIKFREAVRTDTAFTRFQSELKYWMDKANGRTTYSKEVKALFDRNKPLLARVYKQYGDPAMNTKGAMLYQRKDPVQLNSLTFKNISQLLALPVAKQTGPPMIDTWRCSDEFNSSPLEVQKNKLTGEIIYTVRETYFHTPAFVQHHDGFITVMDVPEDPAIIAARIHFEYSFFYTGWDTHGSSNSVQLVCGLPRNNEFHSEAMMTNTDTIATKIPCLPRLCIVEELMPADSIAGEFGEVHVNKQGSYTIDGYTKPGSHLYFYVGFGYSKGSHYGLNGHYLYGEFKVKKITVTYYKAMPQ
jgi:hypothetical protein